jgi:glycosyltransferase involved in cell wall biosynthesis
MRILTVADFFYPGVTGGASIVIYEVMRRLVERGHQVTALIRQQPGTPSCVAGMEVHSYVPAPSEALYPLSVVRCRSAVRRLLAAQQVDIVNAHHAFSGLAAALALWGRQRIPSVFFFHGPWHKEALAKDGLLGSDHGQQNRLPLRYRLRRAADRAVLASCDRVVGLSDYMKTEAAAIFPGVAGKYHKIPGGVDLGRFCPAADRGQVRRRLGLPEKGPILLTVRRLAARMGLEELVRAMAWVEQMRPDATLLIGGSGELRGRLEQLVTELGLRKTRLLGYIPDQDLPAYYQASDLFIMPSLALEGFGLSTLEALACGVPVLGTPVGGTPEILAGVLPEFVLKDVGPDDLAAGILARLPRLPDAQLSLRARRYAEQFDWHRIANSVEELFAALSRR